MEGALLGTAGRPTNEDTLWNAVGGVTSAPLSCMVFSGTGGVILVLILGGFTVVVFIAIYLHSRCVTKTEQRHPKIFFLDLSKMLIVSVVSIVVNYTFTAKVSRAAEDVQVRGKPLEGIGWYAATSTMDVLVGVPISIILGRVINHLSNYLTHVLSPQTALWDFCRQNIVYGKYSEKCDEKTVSCGECPPAEFAWWYAQTATWGCAYVLGSVISGFILLGSFVAVRSTHNPIAWMAVGITYWNVNCLLKQWVVVTFTKIVLTYARLSMVDFFNKYTVPNTL